MSENCIQRCKSREDASLETVDGDLETVDAGLETVDGRVETVDAGLERVDAQVETVDAGLGRVDARVETKDARLEMVDMRVDGVAVGMAVVEGPSRSLVAGNATMVSFLGVDSLGVFGAGTAPLLGGARLGRRDAFFLSTTNN